MKSVGVQHLEAVRYLAIPGDLEAEQPSLTGQPWEHLGIYKNTWASIGIPGNLDWGAVGILVHLKEYMGNCKNIPQWNTWAIDGKK